MPVAEPVALTAGTLPNIDDEWPATQRMAYHADSASAATGSAEGMAISRPRMESAPPFPFSPLPPRSVRRSASRRSSRSLKTVNKPLSWGQRLGTWSVLIAVVVLVAVGWGYVYNSRNSAVPALAKEPPVPAPVEPVAPPPAVQLAEPVQIGPALPPVAEPLPVEPVKPVAAAAPKSRKPTSAVAVAVPPPVAPAPEPAPRPAPEPVALAHPQSLCAGLNFFARAQCMAAQCAKADYKSHAQCEAVRRQQQIDEEKRNPTLLN